MVKWAGQASSAVGAPSAEAAANVEETIECQHRVKSI
jgi:hypothetical protein